MKAVFSFSRLNLNTIVQKKNARQIHVIRKML